MSQNCTECDDQFESEEALRVHIESSHDDQEWTCNDCSFQAHSSDELRNHLRLTGHQPSRKLQDSKSQIITCYTCKKEFLSYWSLMNHRKKEHPSNKTCRYFIKNQCIHGANCWYRHDEPMDIDLSQNSTGVNAQTSKRCDKEKEGNISVKAHFQKKHDSKTSDQVFQKNPESTLPPETVKDIMEKLTMVLQKMNVLEEKVQNMQ